MEQSRGALERSQAFRLAKRGCKSPPRSSRKFQPAFAVETRSTETTDQRRTADTRTYTGDAVAIDLSSERKTAREERTKADRAAGAAYASGRQNRGRCDCNGHGSDCHEAGLGWRSRHIEERQTLVAALNAILRLDESAPR